MKAMWNGAVIAQSDNTIVIEGNHYFPPDSVDMKYLESSNFHTTCPWKGEARYFHIVVDGERNEDAAWCYPNPKEEALNIKGYIAFWRGVEVSQ